MLLALLLSIFVLCLYRMRFYLKGFNEDYLSKDSTNSIKGIFILLIVISHALPYITRCGYAYSRTGDSLLMTFFYILSQMVVVMFLFYSGYGVSESFKSRGEPYVKSMPRHRILGTLLNFDVAVLVFIVVDLFLGIELTANRCLMSLTAWKEVGNSNWYIFVILFCYLMTYITLRLPITTHAHNVVVLFGLCGGCLLILSMYKQNYWYNKILCYPLGFMYSSFKDKFEFLFKSYYWKCLSILVVALVLIYLSHHILTYDRFQLRYNAMSIVFGLMMIALTMKVRINNSVLKWFGRHLFPVYIYMRLPMIVMESKTPLLASTYPALFILIALAVTVLIAYLYKNWEIKL